MKGITEKAGWALGRGFAGWPYRQSFIPGIPFETAWETGDEQ